MKGPDRWDEPDWDWLEPVEFTSLHFGPGSATMVILLGGVIIGLIAAIWHLAG